MGRRDRSFSARACLLGLGVLALATPSSAQSPAEIQQAIDAAYGKFRTLKEGKNADYIPALAKVDPDLFGIAVITADGKVYTAGDVKTEVSIQSISKVFTMAQVIAGAGAGLDRETHRRRCHGRTVQLDYRGRSRQDGRRDGSAGDEPAGESGRDLGDEHGDGNDIGCGVAEDHRLPQRRRGTTAERAAGRLQVRVRHQPAQPGHRRAHARLRLHQGQLAAGGRPLHASVLHRGEREGPGDDGGNAGSGRQEPRHRQTGHRRGKGPQRPRRDVHRRLVRRLREVAVPHGPSGQERRRRRHHRRVAGQVRHRRRLPAARRRRQQREGAARHRRHLDGARWQPVRRHHRTTAQPAAPKPSFEIYGFAMLDVGHDFKQIHPNWYGHHARHEAAVVRGSSSATITARSPACGRAASA